MHARNASPPRDLRLAGTSFIRRRFVRWTCACPIRRIRLRPSDRVPLAPRTSAGRGSVVLMSVDNCGPWVCDMAWETVVTTVVPVRYSATVLFCSMRCDLVMLNKLNMLLRSWIFLVRSLCDSLDPRQLLLS